MVNEIIAKLKAIDEGKISSTIVMVTVRVSPKVLLHALRRDIVTRLTGLVESNDASIQPVGQDCMVILLPEMPGHRAITLVRKISDEITRFEHTLPQNMRIVHEILTTPKDTERIKSLLISTE